MAWLNWFSGKNNKSRADARVPLSDVLSSQQADAARSSAGGRQKDASAQPAATASSQRLEQRRTERNVKRELLFQVVREAMVRIGVLSSAFKFKVLSLDQRGRSFLVMIELSAEFSGEVEKLAEIESMIAQTARHRYEIIVQAVYWRYFNASTPVATTSAPAPLLGALHAPVSRPAPLFGLDGASAPVSRPSPLDTPLAALAPVSAIPGVTSSFPIIGATTAQLTSGAKPVFSPAASNSDDLSEDEVAAFRRALATGASQGAMAAPLAPVAPTSPSVLQTSKPATAAKDAPAPNKLDKARSKLLLTGYEDTEMVDDDPLPALSGTQYGELR